MLNFEIKIDTHRYRNISPLDLNKAGSCLFLLLD